MKQYNSIIFVVTFNLDRLSFLSLEFSFVMYKSCSVRKNIYSYII